MGGGGGAAAPRFSPPDPRFQASFLGALREVHAEGRHLELPAARLADPGVRAVRRGAPGQRRRRPAP